MSYRSPSCDIKTRCRKLQNRRDANLTFNSIKLFRTRPCCQNCRYLVKVKNNCSQERPKKIRNLILYSLRIYPCLTDEVRRASIEVLNIFRDNISRSPTECAHDHVNWLFTRRNAGSQVFIGDAGRPVALLPPTRETPPPTAARAHRVRVTHAAP